jgi:hypothetical protein
MKLVVPERGVNPNVGGAPRFRLRMKYGVVVNHIARERHVAIQEDGGRGLLGDLLYEPLPNCRISGLCIRGIRKAHIAVGDEAGCRREVVVRNPKSCPGLAEQLAPRKISRMILAIRQTVQQNKRKQSAWEKFHKCSHSK